MARIQSEQLNHLLMQAKFSPQKQRLTQLDACEVILRLIQPGSSYPFEFICFHLTGYRPHGGQIQQDEMLEYDALLSDIPAYAEQLSRTMRITSDSVSQKIYTVESLSKRYRVCQKTISRWRAKGLLGRYLQFPDGRLRLTFLESTVDHYVTKNHRKVDQSKAFSQLTALDRQSIVKRLVRWSHFCPGHRQEAIRRTARKFGRSVETVRTILTTAEAQGHDSLAFSKRPTGIDQSLRKEIFENYNASISIPDLMKKYRRSRTNIYRAIHIEQAQKLLDLDIHYMDSQEFLMSDANDFILNDNNNIFEQKNRKYVPLKQGALSDFSTSDSLNSYVTDINGMDILTGKQEMFLFRQYNYLKYSADKLRKGLDLNRPSGSIMRQVRNYLRMSREVQDVLTRSNLRLVVSVARKHAGNVSEMPDLISDGNMTLLNAIEKFNYERGNKFSTYATWAIVKRFATYYAAKGRHQAEYIVSDEMLEVASNLRIDDNQVTAVESARKSLEDIMDETLEERERIIVCEHYGLTIKTDNPETTGRRKPRSLSQISALVGLSKERVRQIELFALQKLRRVLTVEQFDILIKT